MSEATLVTWSKNDKPFNWDPDRAVPFFKLAGLVDRFLRPGLSIQREHLLVIYCHESGFANVRQAENGPAVGFGQMEIYNPDKIPFFQTLRYNSAILNPRIPAAKKRDYAYLDGLFPLTYESILNDDEFAVRSHCAYFAWLFDEGVPANAPPGVKGIKSLKGMLQAQTGGGKNLVFVDHFVNSAAALAAVIKSGNRKKIIDALNSVRHYYNKAGTALEHRPLSLDRFRKYWDFVLPENEFHIGTQR
jgi:hypothetical protein